MEMILTNWMESLDTWLPYIEHNIIHPYLEK